MTSPEIREIVTRVYREDLELPPEWTPAQRTAFLEQEAARISYRVAEVAAEMGAQAITQWTTRTGAHPDYMTTVGLHNTAAMSAKEMVLAEELYELIPEPDDDWIIEDLDPPAGLPDRSQVPWDQRWDRPQYRSDPSEELQELAATVWPDPAFTVLFRIKAGYLLAARAEDAMALPAGPGEDLAAQLAQMVYADLRRDGWPEQ